MFLGHYCGYSADESSRDNLLAAVYLILSDNTVKMATNDVKKV